jgi:hypothetical protein
MKSFPSFTMPVVLFTIGGKVAVVRGRENKMPRKKRTSMDHGSRWRFLLEEVLEVTKDMEDVALLETKFGGQNKHLPFYQPWPVKC